MVATVDDVLCLDLVGDFDDIPPKFIQCTLDREVTCHAPEGVWGEKHVIAQSLVAAHIVTLAQEGSDGPAGPVVSESAGGLSRTYASGSGGTESDAYWSSTSYGRRYLALRRTLPLTPLTLHCPVTVPPCC